MPIQTQTTREAERLDCYNCGVGVSGVVYREVTNSALCDDCFNELTFCCDNCSTYYVNDNCYRFRGLNYCEGCKDDVFFYCQDCGEGEYFEDGLYVYDYGDVCGGCSDNYGYCEVCNEYYRIDFDGSCPECCGEEGLYFGVNRGIKDNKIPGDIVSDVFGIDCFGLELETYKDNNGKNVADFEGYNHYFDAVGDGSLNDCNGIEYRSVPLRDCAESWDKVRKFLKILNDSGHSVRTDCGFHLHISINPELIGRKSTFQKLLLGYMAIENVLYRAVPMSRRDNNFCRRLTSDLSFKKIFDRKGLYETGGLYSYYYGSVVKNKNWTYFKCKYPDVSSKRYYFLNLHSIFFRGTIELRLHGGTIDYKKIVNWYKLHKLFIGWLLDKKTTVAEVMRLQEGDLKNILSADVFSYLNARICNFGGREIC